MILIVIPAVHGKNSEATWTYESMEAVVPTQINGHDCGVYLINLMNFISQRNSYFPFEDMDMDYKRKKIIYAIGTGILYN